MSQLAHDWGLEVVGRVQVDSSAAIAVASRRGNRKLRHVRVGNLWIQEQVEAEELSIKKVPGEWNPADLVTKGLAKLKNERFTNMAGQRFQDGRSEVCPNLVG